MKADRPLAAIRHGIGQQQYLDLRFGKATVMHFLEKRRQAVDENRRRRHGTCDVWDEAEGIIQTAQSWF
jgi:hypothetical protein